MSNNQFGNSTNQENVFDNNSCVAFMSVEQKAAFISKVYQLLALSMIPSIGGALTGLTVLKPLLYSMAGSPMLFFIGYFAASMFLMSAIRRNEHSNTGLFLLGVFTFMSGLILSFTLGSVLRFSNGMELVGIATGGTTLAFFGLAAYTKTTKRDLSKMGTMLLVGGIGFLVFAFANTFLHSSTLSNAMAAFGCVFFSLFLSFDLYQLQRNPEYYGGPISATLEIFLSVFNLFTSLLRILGLVGGDD